MVMICYYLSRAVCLRPTRRYYADIRQTISASDQEMNSALAELSRVRYHLVSPFC